MSEQPTKYEAPALASAIEQVLITGDLAKLSSEQRVVYYNRVCQSLGLNPFTKPFDYISLNGKLRLYALKDCADQLRRLYSVSIRITARDYHGDVYIVTAQASLPDGRCDESTGAVTTGNLKGEALANALMKAETKAKRRATLSIVGLGMLDENETDTIRGAQRVRVNTETGEIEGEYSAGMDRTPDEIRGTLPGSAALPPQSTQDVDVPHIQPHPHTPTPEPARMTDHAGGNATPTQSYGDPVPERMSGSSGKQRKQPDRSGETPEQRRARMLYTKASANGWHDDEVKALLFNYYDKESALDLNDDQWSEVFNAMLTDERVKGQFLAPPATAQEVG